MYRIVELPIMLPDGKPIGEETGFMITQQIGPTRRRICIIEASHYLTMEEARQIAELFLAALKNGA